MTRLEARRVWIGGAASALLALSPLAGCATGQTQEETQPTPAAEAEPVAPAAASDRKPWNAEEMTHLTGELARAVRDVRRAWRREPAFRDPHNPNRRSALQLDQQLRALDQRTTQLHNRVRGGAGFDDTLNIARNIRQLLNDVDTNARRIMSSQWMDERIRPAMELINQIAPFYGSSALFDTETLQRTDRPPSRR